MIAPRPEGEAAQKGLACPACGGLRWMTYKTRPAIGGLRRIRICKDCFRRIITYERPAFEAAE